MKPFDYENAPELEEIRGYFTQEEWEKFEANMTLKGHFKREVFSGWGYEKGLEDYRKDNIIQYIDSAFPWDETPEGEGYWNKLQETLRARYASFT